MAPAGIVDALALDFAQCKVERHARAPGISMSNSTSSLKSILLLTLAGLISGFLSGAAGNMPSNAPGSDAFSLVYKGLLFGFCVSGYFAIFEKVRAIWRIAGFIVACAAADMASFYAGRSLNSVNALPSDPMGLELPISMFLAAGFAGAFIILAAGLLLFGPRGMNWKAFVSALLGAVAGGLLGILGWKIGALLSSASPLVSSLQESTLFVLWQAGVALILGLILTYERSRAAAQVQASIS
jgi:hypothetical protein